MTRKTLLTLSSLVLALALAGPAQADRSITRDVVQGDGARDRDLTKVTTQHTGKRVVIKTRAHRDSEVSDEIWHLVDTTGDATPEFLVFSVVAFEVGDHPSVSVNRVDRWPSRKNPYRVYHDSEKVDCGLHRARIKDQRRLLTATLGRGCFRTDGVKPGRIRVSTFGTFDWGEITDVVPAWRTYGRWTSAD